MSSLICPAATEYKPKRYKPVENAAPFRAFLDWQRRGAPSSGVSASDQAFLIQMVRHPQMQPFHPSRTVRWFKSGSGGAASLHGSSYAGAGSVTPTDFAEVSSGAGFNMANSYMNYVCNCPTCGQGKGWYYELNLYVKPGSMPSHHHISTVQGVLAPRNTADDGKAEASKGPHWTLQPHEYKAPRRSYNYRDDYYDDGDDDNTFGDDY